MIGIRHHASRIGLVLVTAAATAGLLAPPSEAGAMPTTPNAVLAWNATAGDAAMAACIAPLDNPLHESRMYAMMHIAIHDALNAIQRRSAPYVYDARARGRTSPQAATAAAAHDVLVRTISQIPAPFPQACLDAGTAVVQTAYATALAAVPDSPAKTRGIALGQASAGAVLTLRAADGSDTPLIDAGYPQGTAPGEYRFTPGTPFAFAPGWGDVHPFALKDAGQYRPGPPPALTSRTYTNDFREVKRLGGDGITTPTERTAQQTETALFWWESSPLSWNRIARTIATSRHLDAWDSARLFGLLNMALADGYIGSFATKYHDNFWRPVTAIQTAATDTNPDTDADLTWTPLRTTPPIPDYDSAHAVEGGAATAVLQGYFHTDRISFTACSRTLPAGSTCTDPTPLTRHYISLSQAAHENGVSRIYIGFHFRTAVEQGITHGQQIGTHAVDHYLQPTH
jgi:hypothetical protein